MTSERMVLLPVLLLGGGWLGSRFGAPASRLHPTVSLADQLVRAQDTPPKYGALSPDDFQRVAGLTGAQARVLNLLDQEVAASGVLVFAMGPGLVRTAFGAEDPGLIFRVLVPFLRPLMKTPQQGAATSIHLASSPALDGVTGTYFANRRPQASSKASQDQSAAGRLWRVSARLVGVDGESAGQVGQGESND
jgi:hypothetical protein